MMSSQEWPAQKVREWLLAILRFAVTLDQADLATVQAVAIEMDRLGSQPDATTFAFFARSSAEFGHAIANKDDPNSIAVLRRQLARIDDRRLRRALEAALDCEQRTARPTGKRDSSNLWKGLTPTRY
jgi:hypothetical protein